jgi:adenylate cyclase
MAVFFALLSFTPFFNAADNRVYDIFLRFRPKRERIDNVVFLDIDDQAIAHVGVFPWPRSVMADGLLRLKEYGAEAAIFDIEYIDKSPTQINEVYLQRGLPRDYNRRFGEIDAGMADLLSAISAGYIRGADAANYIKDIAELIASERDSLYQDTLHLMQDDDLYLSRAAALYGKAWGTLNLQDELPLSGEQAERRTMAEQKFSYPVVEKEGAVGGINIDVLPAIPLVMEAVKGAGFTNVEIDDDGIRRRIYLAQKVLGRWYLQLSFAPLIDYLGNPSLEVGGHHLVIKNAKIPGKALKDITVPLDEKGTMLLDWPDTDYNKSFSHESFARFSYLEEYFSHIQEYLYNLEDIKGIFPALSDGAAEALSYFIEAETAKQRALENKSEADFEEYVRLKDEGLRVVEELTAAAPGYLEEQLAAWEDRPDYAILQDDALYCETLLEYLENELRYFMEIQENLKITVNGKLCILGRVDTGTTDIGVNPFYGKYVNVGTHAVVLDTILSQSFITPLSPLWSLILCILLVPAFITAISGLKPGIRFLSGIAGIIVLTGIALGLFCFTGIYLRILGPVLALGTAILFRETIAFINSEREKQFIRKAFSTYLSSDVVQEILEDPGKLQLGGSKRYMSAMFTDVQGFSTISEKLDPEDLVHLLNEYLSALSNVVLDHRGTIDKYEGDAIIAFFGAPLETPDHALRACTSAIIMKRIERELNAGFAETNFSPMPLLTRIGINTGDMVVGNMGTQKKMDYTIMGNAVNLSARLEGVNKQYNTWILASEDTVKGCEGKIICRRLDRVRVMGIHEPVRLYEIMDLAGDASPALIEKVELFNHAITLFENREWPAAEAAFEMVLKAGPDDGPAKIFMERCKLYQTRAPDQDWDGVFNLDRK